MEWLRFPRISWKIVLMYTKLVHLVRVPSCPGPKTSPTWGRTQIRLRLTQIGFGRGPKSNLAWIYTTHTDIRISGVHIQCFTCLFRFFDSLFLQIRLAKFKPLFWEPLSYNYMQLSLKRFPTFGLLYEE